MLFNTFNEEKNYIFLRVSEKCSANCSGCNLPEKENTFLSTKKLGRILERIDDFFPYSFSVIFLGYNIIEDIEHTLPQKAFPLNSLRERKYFILVDFFELYNNEKRLLFIQKNYKSTCFFLQKSIKWEGDLRDLIKLTKWLEGKDTLSVHISINSTLDDSKKLLAYLLRFPRKKSFDKVIFFINQSQLEFSLHDFIISDPSKSRCILLDNFSLWKDEISIWDLEVTVEWNITFHESPVCNKNVLSVTSILKNETEIIKDFNYFRTLLDERDSLWKDMCTYCEKNTISL